MEQMSFCVWYVNVADGMVNEKEPQSTSDEFCYQFYFPVLNVYF